MKPFKTWWSKSGKKYRKDEIGGVSILVEDSALATIITPSLKELLKIFGENIMALKTRGGKQIESDPAKYEKLGITIRETKDNSFEMNYSKEYSKRYKHDDLTDENINKIIRLLDAHNIEDCAVEYILIKIKDKKLREIIEDIYNTKIKTDVFYAELKLNMCEGKIDREKWEDTKTKGGEYNMRVLAPLKFKRSILHCTKLIDEDQLYEVKKSKRFYYINWKQTKKSIGLESTSPTEVASALKQNLMPHGYIKSYKLDKQNKLVLTSMN